MALDLKIFYFLNNLAGHSGIFDAVVVFLASYSQYVLGAVFLLFLYFSSYPEKKKIYIFGVAMISVVIARLGITELIRFFYHRPRPFMALSISHLLTDNNWSFPSGHSAFFFALAMAIYFYNKKWGWWFLAGAFLMNISRVMAGIHYPSDILGGVAIGILTAYFVFYLAQKRPFAVTS